MKGGISFKRSRKKFPRSEKFLSQDLSKFWNETLLGGGQDEWTEGFHTAGEHLLSESRFSPKQSKLTWHPEKVILIT